MQSLASHGLVLGTFMPFHKGHEMLIRFASEYLQLKKPDEKSYLLVIISSREQEPITGDMRYDSILDEFIHHPQIVIHHHDDSDAPQNPKGDNDDDFWKYWVGVVEEAARKIPVVGKIDYVFSSENYGNKMAEVLSAEHVTFDKERHTSPISGTKIRNEPFRYANYINRHLRSRLVKNFVMFGAESVGKSTFTKILGKSFYGLTLQEYARPFLMSKVDKSPSIENMKEIFIGQKAYETASLKTDIGQIVNFLDTDIMSTVGYAELIGMDYTMFDWATHVDSSKHYFILSQDDVPYEYDVLRYGNGIRETKDDFWINLLERFNLPYTVIEGKTIEDRQHIMEDVVHNIVNKQFSFIRE